MHSQKNTDNIAYIFRKSLKLCLNFILPTLSIINILETANLDIKTPAITPKKSWQTPEIEVINIKSKTEQELFSGFNLLGPRGTNAS